MEVTTHSLEKSFPSDNSTSCSHLDISNLLYPKVCQMFLQFPQAPRHPSTGKKNFPKFVTKFGKSYLQELKIQLLKHTTSR